MKVTIDLTKKEIDHITPEHSFLECCSDVENIMRRIQKECIKLRNKLRKPKVVKRKKVDPQNSRKEWYLGRHKCGDGFRGHVVRIHGITFCNLCGKENRKEFK